MEGCRHSSLEILSTRGTHCVVFADAAKAELRRYVLVSKAEIEVGPSLEEENFHWIFALAPGGGTSIVISIQSQYWVFASPCAYLTFGWLPADDPKLLRLPEGSAEFLAVTFEAGWQSEDSVAFIPEVEEIPAALRGSYKEFYHAYSEIDGYQLSFESKGFKGSALTYGESHFKPILDILQRLEVGPKDILLDLGSGTGRVVLAAALACPFLKLCRGIELLPSLHGAAQDALGRLCGARIAAPVELICGDLVEEDWSDATVVFAMSLCFPEEMMEALEQKFRQLRPGSYVILMHCFMGDASCLVPHPREGEHAVRLEFIVPNLRIRWMFLHQDILLEFCCIVFGETSQN